MAFFLSGNILKNEYIGLNNEDGYMLKFTSDLDLRCEVRHIQKGRNHHLTILIDLISSQMSIIFRTVRHTSCSVKWAHLITPFISWFWPLCTALLYSACTSYSRHSAMGAYRVGPLDLQLLHQNKWTHEEKTNAFPAMWAKIMHSY